MNELHILKGSIKTSGKIAYVEQEPFMMSGTILENILFGNPCDKLKLTKVVKVCQLDQDIRSFPSGLSTDIGQGGVTLSGGQKARISLARAVYSDADIYLLDDPLSAVDPNVADNIFNLCFKKYLKDK